MPRVMVDEMDPKRGACKDWSRYFVVLGRPLCSYKARHTLFIQTGLPRPVPQLPSIIARLGASSFASPVMYIPLLGAGRDLGQSDGSGPRRKGRTRLWSQPACRGY